MSEDALEEGSTNDEYDQDSSISVEDDAHSTASQEDEVEDWIEYAKRSIATQSPDRWTRKAAEWNPGLIMSTRSQRKAEKPAKRWEDDQNEFVKDEETQTTQSNDLKTTNTRLTAAKKIYE